MGLLSSCEKAGRLLGANKPPEGVICRMLSRLASHVAISRTFLKRRVHMLEQANRGLRQRSRRHQPEIIREQFGITQFVAHYSFNHLVGARRQPRRHVEVERLGGLEVNDRVDFSGLLDLQVAG